MSKVQRNDKCACGSGLKYKVCCRLVPTPVRISVALRYLERENEALREVLRAAEGRFEESGLLGMGEWIAKQEQNKEESVE